MIASVVTEPAATEALAAAMPVDPQLIEYEDKLAAWTAATAEHSRKLDAYWRALQELRARGEFTLEQPPLYTGPSRPVHPTNPQPEEPPPPSTIPTKPAFLAAAKEVYAFVPDEKPESDFKLSYAKEALAAQLSADAIVRVYAFETGGNGRHDTQPIRKNVGAISTALGYAQLLNANSVMMLSKHGESFAKALDVSDAPGAKEKASIVRKMHKDAAAVADDWAAYQKFAKTPAGRAMHACNLDVDVGPKMQMRKLRDVVETAKRAGHAALQPAQLELLNLAGEENGLLMLDPKLATYPTANFFDRAGYEANPVVHQRTAESLLRRIEDTMTKNIEKPGAQELLRAFAALGPS